MTDGTTAAGTVLIIMAASTVAGMIRGSGEVPGDGMTLGTARITIHTTADGTEDGTLTGDIIITTTDRGISILTTVIRKTYGTAQGTGQVQNAYSAAVHHSEEV